MNRFVAYNMPKIELHCHLDGSMSVDVINNLLINRVQAAGQSGFYMSSVFGQRDRAYDNIDIFIAGVLDKISAAARFILQFVKQWVAAESARGVIEEVETIEPRQTVPGGYPKVAVAVLDDV